MFAIVGLGNPGKKYEPTRHNAGAWVLEELARLHGSDSWNTKFKAKYQTATISEQKCVLALPQTYMNLSGESVGPLCSFYDIKPESVIVLHDELDLSPGQVRIKKGGSTAGHRGLNDIASHFASKDFYRVRLGIGHPRDVDSKMDVSSWVTSQPDTEDSEKIRAGVGLAAQAVEVLLSGGLEEARRFVGSKS